MPFREATYADLLPASQILAAAFKNDAFQGKYLRPHLDKYPDDLARQYLRTLRTSWARASPDNKLLVSFKPSSRGKGEECLTGVVVVYYNYLESLILPDRAAEPERQNILTRAFPYAKHHWTGTRAEVWYLNVVGVDPAFEGQGIGRELVAWGFERARQEGVGTSCIAASDRDRFYKACGFDVQCGIAGDEGPDHELRTTLRNIGGGTIHFWDGGMEAEGVREYGEE
ncbi:hypothetical protein LTR91_020836 [Friedmanniomyces endolithicus]|uniref:N-acetyltransferase domain-containing protein n=1 Tax=Friedmanniomyces endolithicus TaxID=329885 RepID=A0AAN6K0R8_9PEZI|nr:hypothetical protein LTR57_018914 [Friedmanniomyces endolithicus]KAK0959460.1 hypothetical protein LTR91_020836 [Friedmanniomyces endolithicus]